MRFVPGLSLAAVACAFACACAANIGIPWEEPSPTPSGDWWNCAYEWRAPIDVDPTIVGAAAPIRIDATTVGALPNAEDIRVVAADNTTPLPYEIESWGTDALIWIRPTSEQVWLYYGNANATDAQDPPAVWSDYLAVWHLDSASSVDSSTGTGTPGTASVSGEASGAFGSALSFNGSSDIVAIDPVFKDALTSFTVSAWVRVDTLGDTEPFFSGLTGDSGFELIKGFGDRVRVSLNAGVPVSFADGMIDATDRYYHVAFSFDDSDNRATIFLDGVEVASQTVPSSLQGGNADLELGHSQATNDFLSGRIDEVRVWDGARAESELAAEASTTNSSTTVVGTEESSSCN